MTKIQIRSVNTNNITNVVRKTTEFERLIQNEENMVRAG